MIKVAKVKIKNKYIIFSNPSFLSHEYYFKEFSFLPYPYGEDDYNYELNKKETFSLDMTILAYLYEHLTMYKEVAGEILDLDYRKFNINDSILTEEQCINRMLDDIRVILSIDDSEYISVEDWKEKDRIMEEKKNDLFDVLKVCFWALWW